MLIICLVGLVLLTVLWRRKFVILLAVTGLFACLWVLPPPAVIERLTGNWACLAALVRKCPQGGAG